MKEADLQEKLSLPQRILKMLKLNRGFAPTLGPREKSAACVHEVLDRGHYRSFESNLSEIERMKTEAIMERQRRSFV